MPAKPGMKPNRVRKMAMKIIGVTGGTGAGKSSLCDELKKCGATVLDCDRISRNVPKNDGSAFDEIIEVFGEEMLAADGELNRKALAAVVFNDEQKLELLNKITHKHIFAEMQKQLDECKTHVAVMDVPLLFNADFPFKCDLTVAVLATPELRLERIMSRDGISETAALERMKNQMTDDEYKNLADVCFVNDGNPEKVREFAKELCRN